MSDGCYLISAWKCWNHHRKCL